MPFSRTTTLARFTRRTAVALAAAPLLLGSAWAQQATWPDKMIKLIVPFPAGGSTDTVARALALSMGEQLGKPFVVENRPGASALIGTRYVKGQPADGYTLLAGSAVKVCALTGPRPRRSSRERRRQGPGSARSRRPRASHPPRR